MTNRQITPRRPSPPAHYRPKVINGECREVRRGSNDSSVIAGTIVGLFIGGLGIGVIMMIILLPYAFP
jgi:hypothetical protein